MKVRFSVLVVLLALAALAAASATAAGRAAGPTRIVFVAGSAPQCHRNPSGGRDCGHPKDVIRSISPHGAGAKELAKVRSVIELSGTEDGRVLAILSRIVAGGGANAHAFTQIYLLSHGNLREVFSERIEGFSPTGLAISPNGGSLALAGRGGPIKSTTPNESRIFVLRANGGGLHQLTAGPGADSTPSFSPDGKRIVFSRETKAKKTQLWTVAVNGGAETKLTSSSADDVNPVFSPDGANIAFGRVAGDHKGRIMVMRAKGTGIHAVASSGGEFPDPDYSPSGRSIVFSGEAKQGHGFTVSLFTVSANGAHRSLVTPRFAFPTLPQWTSR